MPKKQPDPKSLFQQQYPAMAERVDARNKGLTLRQSKLALYMLVYLQEREKTLSRELANAYATLDGEEVYAHRLTLEWNELTGALCELFHLKVTGGMGENHKTVWDVTYPGGISTGHETAPQAFMAGIEAVLKAKEQEGAGDEQH